VERGNVVVPSDWPDREEMERRVAEAAAWKSRLDSPDAAASEFLAFEAWLGGPGARRSFDRIDTLASDIEVNRDIIGQAMVREDAERIAQLESAARRSDNRRRLILGGVGVGIGALAAAAVGGVFWAPQLGWSDYVTVKGETRSIKLADGTSVRLNSASAIRVKISGKTRRVLMGGGEAAFDVAHDTARPFLVAVGDNQIRVVGTEFNVLNASGRVAVTVRRGIVEVSGAPKGHYDIARLTAGDQLAISAGGVVRRANAAEGAFAWQSGRLVYDGATLAELVSDLNRYYSGPIRVEGEDAAALKFSGVLALDGREQVVRRLEAFLPVEAVAADGEIILRAHAKPVAP
jgi:transmembrane sensor